MKLVIQFLRSTVILGGLMLALPTVGVADKPEEGAKHGRPNKNSVAITAACTVDDDTARACSCKGLSNIVLQCGSTWVKHDDIGLDAETGIETEVFDATFDCGTDAEGDPVPGPITMVAVKSGSQKNAKHNPDDYEPVLDAPSGSGLFFGPEACTADFACPAEGDCSSAEEPPPPPSGA